MDKKVLSEPEAATFLGISSATLKKARLEGPREGRISAPNYVKAGRCVRYRIEDLMAWLEKHLVANPGHGETYHE